MYLIFLGQNDPNDAGPEFLAQLTNFTVPQGRDISFTCVVDNLGPYRVSTQAKLMNYFFT